MSKVGKGIFAAAAVGLSLGVAEFASGHDLAGSFQALTSPLQTPVNRSVKSDRAPMVRAPAAATRTVGLRLDRLSDTSILVRIPVAEQTRKLPAAPPLAKKPTSRKMAVACEAVVSTLTDVAKLLEPGRCVT
jgi:hypothetical protein